MKRLFPLTLLLAASLVFVGCADTNDRGVIIDKPFDLFGATTKPAPANQTSPTVNASPATPAANA